MNKFFEKTQKNALISVYHKDGILPFAKALCALGWTIYSSGGTAKFLHEASIPVIDVSTMVGEPILGHRVVTISRELHAGLLADKLKLEDLAELESLGLPFFGLVCVDFYPLIEEIRKPGVALNAVIEKTDIGGPLMVRSGAKGNRLVICDPADRESVIELLSSPVSTEDMAQIINQFAAKAEAVVANYVLQSATYRGNNAFAGVVGEKIADVRYGENPWQKGYGLFRNMNPSDDPLGVNNWQIIAGNPGYVNYTDVDRMLHTLTHIAEGLVKNQLRTDLFIALGAKHGNPCGAALSPKREFALERMLEGNLKSIFGGTVLTNFMIDSDYAHLLRTHKQATGKRIFDLIIAPDFTQDAIDILNRKDEACKMIAIPELSNLEQCKISREKLLRPVRGGFLMQDNYHYVLDCFAPKDFTIGSRIMYNMVLAWAINATSTSNTITIVDDEKLIGNGTGQADRVECCELAIKRARYAGHEIAGATVCSDSFFPFVDGPKTLIEAGVKVILGNSGSIKDKEVQAYCEDKGCKLLLIPNAIGRGFFGH